jgi:hypothetical protein
MEPTGVPKSRSRSPWVGVGLVSAVINVASTAVVLFLVPLSHQVNEESAFAIVVPYNASDHECTGLIFDHLGVYSFALELPGQATGNMHLLTVTDPNGRQLYNSPGESAFNGDFSVSLMSSVYEFCLKTPGFNYQHFGGAAAGLGTLSYTRSTPIL